MTEQEWLEKLKNEGYTQVAAEGFGPNEDVAEHTHEKYTIQVFTEGEIEVIDSQGAASKAYKTGDSMISPAGTTHRAKAGPEGCRFVIGFK